MRHLLLTAHFVMRRDNSLFPCFHSGISWGDHLRQHERVTAENREVERRAQAFHLGPEPPKITHLIPANNSAVETPTRAATKPQTALPTARPPMKTSR